MSDIKPTTFCDKHRQNKACISCWLEHRTSTLRVLSLEQALEWIQSHDLTGEAGCRRAQLVATDALRLGLTPAESIAKHKEK